MSVREDVDPGDLINAIHEAGHAIIATLLGERVKFVTIVPSAGKVGEMKPEDPDYSRVEEWVQIWFAGREAVLVYCGDKERANDGFAADDCNIKRIGRDRQDLEEFELRMQARTIEMLQRPDVWSAVKALADKLVIEKTVSGQDVRAIARGAGILPNLAVPPRPPTASQPGGAVPDERHW